MTKYTEKIDEETGESVFTFNAELVKVGETVLKNSNEKDYKIVEVKFHLPDGKLVERSAMCYASNYEHGLEVGKSYLTTLSFDEEGNPQLRMSHLSNANRATAEDFASLLQVQQQVIEKDFVV